MDSETSMALLERVRLGDSEALDVLLRRYVPALRRWARGRLPRWARDMADTEDLVQDTVFRTLRNLKTFEHRHEGALQAYLRQAVMNRIRDECRRVGKRPNIGELDEDLPDQGVSPLEAAVGVQAGPLRDRAPALKPEEREAIVARGSRWVTARRNALMLDAVAGCGACRSEPGAAAPGGASTPWRLTGQTPCPRRGHL